MAVFRSRTGKSRVPYSRDGLGGSGVKKIHPPNQLLFCFPFPQALSHPRGLWFGASLQMHFELRSVLTPVFTHAKQDTPEGSQLRRAPGSQPYPSFLWQIPNKAKPMQFLMVQRRADWVWEEGSAGACLALHWLYLTGLLCPIFSPGFLVIFNSQLSVTTIRPVQ